MKVAVPLREIIDDVRDSAKFKRINLNEAMEMEVVITDGCDEFQILSVYMDDEDRITIDVERDSS